MSSPSGGKVAVVTGSTAGIGHAIAIALAKKNYIVIGNARREDDRAYSLLAELHQHSQHSRFVPGDVSSESSASEFCRVVGSLVSGVDVLINNAGRTEPTSITSFDAGEWRKQFDANFFSAVLVTNGLLSLVQKCHGSIVNVSSVRGLFDSGREGVMAYSAAKAALNSFTKTLAKALAPNVTVNLSSRDLPRRHTWKGLQRNKWMLGEKSVQSNASSTRTKSPTSQSRSRKTRQ